MAKSQQFRTKVSETIVEVESHTTLQEYNDNNTTTMDKPLFGSSTNRHPGDTDVYLTVYDQQPSAFSNETEFWCCVRLLFLA